MLVSPLDQARLRAPLGTSLVAKPAGTAAPAPTTMWKPTLPTAPRPNIAPSAPGITAPLTRPQIGPTAPAIAGAIGAPPPAARPNIGPTVPPVPQEPPGPITEFGPGNDLRSSQVNPTASDRLKRLQGTVDTGVAAVGSSPSLSDAAAKQFELLGKQSAEQRRLGIQDIGRSAATLGRLGSGMVTTDLGNLEDVLRTREENARAGLSANIAQQEAADRRANLASTSGLEGQVYGQEAGARGEVRGERGYQTDTAQTALENRIRQKALEESLTQGQFGRELGGAGVGLQAGEIQSNAANQASGAAGDVLSNLGLQQSLDAYTKANPTTPLPAGIVASAGGMPTPPRGWKYVGNRLVPLQPGEPDQPL